MDAYGPPASTLTDNGRVYTARHSGARNEFEYVIAALGIRQKNGAPNQPQTQGKIERFHQTLKRWLAVRPRAATITELQTQLDTFQEHYNTARPHRARGTTPAIDYAASPKALRFPPAPGPTPSTTASGTTMSALTERSASAAPPACTTSESASPTAAHPSS